jgi:hypothetical protein
MFKVFTWVGYCLLKVQYYLLKFKVFPGVGHGLEAVPLTIYYLLKFQVFPGVCHGLEAVPLLLEPDVLCVQLLTLQPHLVQNQVLFLCLKSSQHKKICQILPYVSNYEDNKLETKHGISRRKRV